MKETINNLPTPSKENDVDNIALFDGLSVDDRATVEEWQKDFEKFNEVQISGDIIADYNALVDLSENAPGVEKAQVGDDPKEVLEKLKSLAGEWTMTLLQNESIAPTPGRERMKEIYMGMFKKMASVPAGFLLHYTNLLRQK